jgi:hypothetical protein
LASNNETAGTACRLPLRDARLPRTFFVHGRPATTTMKSDTDGRMQMLRSTATGSMTLLTERDEASGQEVRTLRLEPAADGKAVLLIEIDERKAGIHREVRHEITSAELIAAIRAHGAELPGEQHNR